jgi:hypothetical protein
MLNAIHSKINRIALLSRYLMGWTERNVSHTTGQQRSGCYDGYGQTGADYALSAGSQMGTVRRMIAGFGGR